MDVANLLNVEIHERLGPLECHFFANSEFFKV